MWRGALLALGLAGCASTPQPAASYLPYQAQIVVPRPYATVAQCFDEYQTFMTYAGQAMAPIYVLYMADENGSTERAWARRGLNISRGDDRILVRGVGGDPDETSSYIPSEIRGKLWLSGEIAKLDEERTALNWSSSLAVNNQKFLDIVLACAMQDGLSEQPPLRAPEAPKTNGV